MWQVTELEHSVKKQLFIAFKFNILKCFFQQNDQLDFENRPFHDFIGKEPKEYGARDNSDDEMEIGG